MKLQVLGPGCAKCETLAKNVEAAASELGLDFELEKVTNINDIVAFGVMATPALVVDGTVRVSGNVLPVSELKNLLGAPQ